MQGLAGAGIMVEDVLGESGTSSWRGPQKVVENDTMPSSLVDQESLLKQHSQAVSIISRIESEMMQSNPRYSIKMAKVTPEMCRSAPSPRIHLPEPTPPTRSTVKMFVFPKTPETPVHSSTCRTIISRITQVTPEMFAAAESTRHHVPETTPPPTNSAKMFVFPKSCESRMCAAGTGRAIEDGTRSDITEDDTTTADETATGDGGQLDISMMSSKTSAHLGHVLQCIVELLKPTTAKVAPKRGKVAPRDGRGRSASLLTEMTRCPPSPTMRSLKRSPSAPLPSMHGPMSLLGVPYGNSKMGSANSSENTGVDSVSDESLSPEVHDPRTASSDTERGATGGERVRSQLTAASTSAIIANVKMEPGDETIILPCAPSDNEKVMYHKSGRFLLVTCGLLAFYTMSVGMWLFTVASPYFFWFGAPTVFIMFYLICHYLLVALWGVDFKPNVHEKILRKAQERNYFPSVDVFLPVCKEPAILLANTWKYIAALDYPNFTVHVLDDGAQDVVRDLAAQFGFQYVRRPDRPNLKKAGNLRYSFARTTGEAVAVFDADFCPRRDYLRETVPYFLDQSIGILQTPQFFRRRKEQTWIEQGAGVSQEFFYRMVQVNQDRFNAAVCCGSCALYRRAALEPFGGVVAIAHSEDMYTGFKMTTLGYKIKYLPLNMAMGICPDEPQSFFMQQYRWCMGSATLVAEKDFWTSSISLLHKVCFVNGMLYYVASALLIFVAPLPILLLIALEADGIIWYHAVFAAPAIILAGIIVPCWSKQRYDMASHRVKIIQCYAHLFAIKDRMMGRSAPWVPSGGGASKASSQAYRSSVRLMVSWNVLITFLIVGGSAWRMTYLTWYHFIPAIVLALGSFFLNISTLL